jgi:ribosomal protein S18 acetylase RimI-like enzyme
MEIRPTQKADAHSLSCIYVQTWRDTYLSVIPYGYLSSMSIPRHEKAFFNELNRKHIISFVAEDAGRVIGFITGGYERNGDEIYSGEIYTLYVMKNLQRRGLGTQLVSALAIKFNRLGLYSMLVRVLKLNPYRRFYKKINGIYLKTEHLPFAVEIMDVETYGWLDTTLIDD